MQLFRKLSLYLAAIFIPFFLLIFGSRNGMLSPGWFVFLLLTYAVIYHPIISGLRLVAKGIIAPSSLWKNLIPGWNWKYYSHLFLP
ncbi:hypothetical protein [Hydrotalea sp.]|uniref:hypothetical protein n=1 Tax=Hydrotalea sp. TaxID=2881279 RepID=UPI0026262677|nr:hypothetical protein [Hydrotalea sp.]